MPLQEAKLSTNLRLRFRTRQSNGILFLAAGRTDYCLLSIDDGRVKLNLKINEHFTEVNILQYFNIHLCDLNKQKSNLNFIQRKKRFGHR